ncbi:MAG: hypothetical protein JWM39_892 [Parcubacteria group bacterium]|nr:hypothetical protein [Parcubacteria group bacterium]
MANLFRITASNPEAYQHYIDTIERGFSLDSIREYLSERQYDALNAIYAENPIRAWGATPGDGNIRTWEQMELRDPILIYRKGNFEYFAAVTFKIHNPELAKHLWKTNSEGETWEYIYFLDNLTEISVPVKIFNQLLGYSENFFPYGFAATHEDKIKYLEDQYTSINAFLNYLSEGKWVEHEKAIPEKVKKDIIEDRLTRQIGNVSILEANLENLLVKDIEAIEDGLKLVDRQLDTREVGRLDLLCEDRNGDLVVVELKRGAAGQSIIDQTQRYMGWIMSHKAEPNQKVRGIIVVGTRDTALEYAVKANPMMQVKAFTVTVQ